MRLPICSRITQESRLFDRGHREGPLVLLIHGFPETSYRFVSGGSPGWLSEDDADVYAAEFERTGVTGALNRHRNVDRDWEDLVAYDCAAITQPSLFMSSAGASTR